MNKILYYMICAVLLLASCTEEMDIQLSQGTEKVIVSVAADTQYTNVSTPMATTRSTTMSRYIMEVYADADYSIPAKVLQNGVYRRVQTTSEFVLALNKDVNYYCLLWADTGDGCYNADDLKSISLCDNTKAVSEAYYAKITLGKENAQKVTLKRAVAQVKLKDKNDVEAGKILNLQYSEPSQLNLLTGEVNQERQTERRVSTLQTDANGVMAEFYMLAPPKETKFSLTFNYSSEEPKVVSDIPFQANYITEVTGNYGGEHESQYPSNAMVFVIDLTNYDNTYILPFSNSAKSTGNYTLTVDWGDGSEILSISPKTSLQKELITHTFPERKKYVIVITSSEEDGTKEQMPAFKPGSSYYYGDVNNNALKLEEMKTPMLCTGNGTKDFSGCFENCKNLSNIPAGLFEKNPQVTGFNGCFKNCVLLQTIPEGLFAEKTGATKFEQCFYGCEKLQTIPENLFAEIGKVEKFYNTFYGCTSLTAIPAKLFEKNISVLSFSGCFNSCSSLQTIPELLFAKNTEVSNFESCFKSCTKVQLNSNIFCDEAAEKQTRFLNKSVKFDSCFEGCASANTDGGTAPALWSYGYDTGTVTNVNCFKDVTNVNNYNEIPEAWGGATASN